MNEDYEPDIWGDDDIIAQQIDEWLRKKEELLSLVYEAKKKETNNE